VLLYHRIRDAKFDPQLLCVSADNFEAHLQILQDRYRIVKLSEIINDARAGVFKPDTVALTFDDGYLDNLTVAAPLLEKYKIPATIFITSGILNAGYEFWWDELDRIFFQTSELPSSLTMEFTEGAKTWKTNIPAERFAAWEELSASLRSAKPEAIHAVMEFLRTWADIEAEIRHDYRRLNKARLRTLSRSPFIEIGSHTVQHPRLSALSGDEQKEELLQSKKTLEEIIQQPVRLISYPFGSAVDFNDETRNAVSAAGYEAGIANIQAQVDAPFDDRAVPRRLVRNWNGDTFADWLNSRHKDILENQTVSERNAKLRAMLGQNKSVNERS
jgi:peptidoglycan/xylan/chitin deacetylase (PgdA/CDA1 family)